MALIEAGADVNLQDHKGRRALDYAMEHGRHGAARVLRGSAR